MSGPEASVRTALIGHTGFVGSNILRQRHFDDLYNSANVDQIAGRHYRLVVSAAGRADSHRINEHPERDLAELTRLSTVLESVSIDVLVHISTVCVYGPGSGFDEDVLSDPSDLTPYGRNRLWLEQRLAGRFDTLRLRLPQLFGPGAKKGLVFDLANDYRVEYIRPDDVFQHYDLTRLADDIDVALTAGLRVLNVATEPIVHRRLARDVFGIDLPDPGNESSPINHGYTRNMITKHAPVFGEQGDYLMCADQELHAIRRFTSKTDEHAEPRRSDGGNR